MNENNLNNNIAPQPMPNTQPVQPQPIPNPQPPVQPQPMANQTPQAPAQPMPSTEPVAPTPMANPMPQEPVEPQPVNNPVPQQPAEPAAPQKPPKQKSNPVLIALMFVALIGGAVYFGYNKFFANKDTGTTNGGSGAEVVDTTNEEMQNDEAEKIVKEVVKKYNQPYGVICGEVDYEDSITESDESYSASKTYTTISEIDTYLATFLSSDFISSNINKTKYLEKDGKLYCNIPARGTLIYDEDGSTYTIDELTEESITASGSISYSREGGDLSSYPVELTLIKENDSWLLNSYKETR